MSAKKSSNELFAKPGDKVRVRSGPLAGQRGLIVSVMSSGRFSVTAAGHRLKCEGNEITNYSLAARRAWATMPKRAGRPRAAEAKTKMLSIRLPIDLLELVDKRVRESNGRSRSEFIERTLRAAATTADIPVHEHRLRLVRSTTGRP